VSQIELFVSIFGEPRSPYKRTNPRARYILFLPAMFSLRAQCRASARQKSSKFEHSHTPSQYAFKISPSSHEIMSHRLISTLILLVCIDQVLLYNQEFAIQPSIARYTANESVECRNVESSRVVCDFNTSCIYGELNTVDCRVDDDIPCKGEHVFSVTFPCLYCWQVQEDAYSCAQNSTCKANTKYLTTCNVNSTTYCLGHRKFNRYLSCRPETRHKWSTAVVLSILFGGFGADRFYLGHWHEGVGKLFSFGGFGVWTLIDAILIFIGYLKPANSSQ